VKNEETGTAEALRPPAGADGSNGQRLDESVQSRRERCGVRRDWEDAPGGNNVVLARGEMRRAVVVSVA